MSIEHQEQSPYSKISFLGTGMMGSPIAARLISSGLPVAVWNRTQSKVEPLKAAGAIAFNSPVDCVEGADIVISMLSDPMALEQVSSAATDSLGKDAIWLDMSTVGPDAVLALADRVPKGVRVADSPVLGSVPQATEGTLKIFFGGPEDLFEEVSGLLANFGTSKRVGDLGSGAATKIVVNSTLVGLMSVLGEALSLADGLDLDTKNILEVLEESPIGVTASSKKELILSGDFIPRFRLALGLKDATLVEEYAAKAGLSLPVSNAAHDWFDKAAQLGFGDEDYSAVVKAIREQSKES